MAKGDESVGSGKKARRKYWSMGAHCDYPWVSENDLKQKN